MPAKVWRVIGLMSGTSMDGIDAALIETDGEEYVRTGPWLMREYPADLRASLLALTPDSPDWPTYDRIVTDLQIEVVKPLGARAGPERANVDCIGFHGQTILHDPTHHRTHQLGDGARMARALGLLVVNRFRDQDLKRGGEGAPLAPAYHRTLVRTCGLAGPVGVLNIGGVSNLTVVAGEELYACDCGPGNDLLDDWMRKRCDQPYDEDGRTALAGRTNSAALSKLMDQAFFRRTGTKSLDRNAFSLDAVEALGTEDGAATLAAFTVQAIVAAASKLPVQPTEWVMVGGGRRNPAFVRGSREKLATTVRIAEEVGWAGDALEAQAFGYLAVRSMRGLPLSWPTTTGVQEPIQGGVHHHP